MVGVSFGLGLSDVLNISRETAKVNIINVNFEILGGEL